MSKNNFSERLRKMEPKKERFSIRKFTVGAASVLIGFTFFAMSGQQAQAADQNADSDKGNQASDDVDAASTEKSDAEKAVAEGQSQSKVNAVSDSIDQLKEQGGKKAEVQVAAAKIQNKIDAMSNDEKAALAKKQGVNDNAQKEADKDISSTSAKKATDQNAATKDAKKENVVTFESLNKDQQQSLANMFGMSLAELKDKIQSDASGISIPDSEWIINAANDAQSNKYSTLNMQTSVMKKDSTDNVLPFKVISRIWGGNIFNQKNMDLRIQLDDRLKPYVKGIKVSYQGDVTSKQTQKEMTQVGDSNTWEMPLIKLYGGVMGQANVDIPFTNPSCEIEFNDQIENFYNNIKDIETNPLQYAIYGYDKKTGKAIGNYQSTGYIITSGSNFNKTVATGNNANKPLLNQPYYQGAQLSLSYNKQTNSIDAYYNPEMLGAWAWDGIAEKRINKLHYEVDPRLVPYIDGVTINSIIPGMQTKLYNDNGTVATDNESYQTVKGALGNVGTEKVGQGDATVVNKKGQANTVYGTSIAGVPRSNHFVVVSYHLNDKLGSIINSLGLKDKSNSKLMFGVYFTAKNGDMAPNTLATNAYDIDKLAQSDAFQPSYSPVTVKKGESGISNITWAQDKVPEGETFTASTDDFTISFDQNGNLTVVPKDSTQVGMHNIPVTVTYSDETTDKVNVPVYVTDGNHSITWGDKGAVEVVTDGSKLSGHETSETSQVLNAADAITSINKYSKNEDGTYKASGSIDPKSVTASWNGEVPSTVVATPSNSETLNGSIKIDLGNAANDVLGSASKTMTTETMSIPVNGATAKHPATPVKVVTENPELTSDQFSSLIDNHIPADQISKVTWKDAPKVGDTSATVVITFKDNDKNGNPTHLDIKLPEGSIDVSKKHNDADKYTPKYDEPAGKPGETVTSNVHYTPDYTEPTKPSYKLADNAPQGATIDPVTGEVTYVIPGDADTGSVDIPVIITYPDNTADHPSVDKTTATVTIAKGQNVTKPSEGTTTYVPTDVIHNPENLPSGTTVTWTNGGTDPQPFPTKPTQVTVTVTTPDGHTTTITQTVGDPTKDADKYDAHYQGVTAKEGEHKTIPSPILQDNDGKPAYDVTANYKPTSSTPSWATVKADGSIDIVAPTKGVYTIPVTVTYDDGSSEVTYAPLAVTDDNTKVDWHQDSMTMLKTAIENYHKTADSSANDPLTENAAPIQTISYTKFVKGDPTPKTITYNLVGDQYVLDSASSNGLDAAGESPVQSFSADQIKTVWDGNYKASSAVKNFPKTGTATSLADDSLGDPNGEQKTADGQLAGNSKARVLITYGDQAMKILGEKNYDNNWCNAYGNYYGAKTGDALTFKQGQDISNLTQDQYRHLIDVTDLGKDGWNGQNINPNAPEVLAFTEGTDKFKEFSMMWAPDGMPSTADIKNGVAGIVRIAFNDGTFLDVKANVNVVADPDKGKPDDQKSEYSQKIVYTYNDKEVALTSIDNIKKGSDLSAVELKSAIDGNVPADYKIVDNYTYPAAITNITKTPATIYVPVTLKDGEKDKFDVQGQIVYMKEDRQTVVANGPEIKTHVGDTLTQAYLHDLADQNKPANYDIVAYPGNIAITPDMVQGGFKAVVIVKDGTKTINPGDDDATKDMFSNPTRHIIVENPDGTRDTTDQVVSYQRSKTVDAVTGDTISYGNWELKSGSKTQWDAFTTPSLKGYTPSQTSVAAQSVTAETKDQTITINYKKNGSTPVPYDPTNDQMNKDVTRTIITTLPNGDKNTDKQVVHFSREDAKHNAGYKDPVTDQITWNPWHVAGSVDQTSSFWGAEGITGYKGYTTKINGEVGNSIPAKSVTADTPDETVYVTYDKNADKPVHYDPKDDRMNHDVTRIIVTVMPDGSKTSEAQTVKFSREDKNGNAGYQDPVTDKITWNAWHVAGSDKTDGSWAAKDIKQLKGYTSEVDGKKATSVEAKSVNAETPNETVTVNYKKDNSTPVPYKPGTPGENDDMNHYNTRTIVTTMPDGSKRTEAQTVHFTREDKDGNAGYKDPVTDKITWNAWHVAGSDKTNGSWAEQDVKQLDGYKSQVDGKDATKVDANNNVTPDTPNQTVNVTYVKTAQPTKPSQPSNPSQPTNSPVNPETPDQPTSPEQPTTPTDNNNNEVAPVHAADNGANGDENTGLGNGENGNKGSNVAPKAMSNNSSADNGDKHATKKLPQTGDKKTDLGIIGLALAGMASMLGLAGDRKRNK